MKKQIHRKGKMPKLFLPMPPLNSRPAPSKPQDIRYAKRSKNHSTIYFVAAECPLCEALEQIDDMKNSAIERGERD